MQALSRGVNYYNNFNFKVEFTHSKLGNISCGFNGVSGIGITNIFKEYREGGNNKTPDLLLESVSTSPVTLTKGVSLDEAIYNLAEMTTQTVDGVVSPFSNRFDATVYVMDRAFQNAVKTYEMRDCVIEQFVLGDLNSMGTEILLESIVLRFNELVKR